MKRFFGILLFLLVPCAVFGQQSLGPLMAQNNLLEIAVNGMSAQTASRTNILAAGSGANSDITSLLGLTTPLAPSEGGTGIKSPTPNLLLYGGGTGPFGSVPNGLSGNCLQAGLPPGFASCVDSISAGSGISVSASSGNVVVSLAPTIQSGQFVGVQVITASGTYTPDAGTGQVLVLVQAPGGGGGGCPSTTSSQFCAAGSASGGSWAKVWLTGGFSGQPIVIGAPGAGAAAGANAGTAGGAASFGSGATLVSCPGGLGGLAGSAVTAATTSIINNGNGNTVPCTIVGGTATLANSGGLAGGLSIAVAGSSTGAQSSGNGGDSPLGAGGRGVLNATSGTDATGNGAGGSGAASNVSQSAKAGGNGSAGIVVIEEFR